MFNISKWKVISIAAVVLFGLLMALPNLYSEKFRTSLPSFVPSATLVLGLDLQGGSHLLLEVDKPSLIKRLNKQLRGDVRARLWTENKIAHTIAKGENDSLIIRLKDATKTDQAYTLVKALAQPVNTGFFNQGADVPEYDVTKGTGRIDVAFSPTGLESRISKAVEQAQDVIRRRIDELGTANATVQRQGTGRILVQAPGYGDSDSLKKVINQTAKMDFRLLCEDQRTSPEQRVPATCDELEERTNANSKMWVQTSRRATVSGEHLVDAQPAFDQRNGEPIVTFRFNQRGAVEFGKLTQANVNRPFAIVLDDKVVSAPVIREPILGGTGQISGNFTADETSRLAIVLRSGALPAKFVFAQESTVGPSLGSDSVEAGLWACAIGLVAVLLFMVVTYGLFGIFANIALAANLTMLMGVMSAMGFTLTLPGIAGIVLTLGMAVDSNVLVFERIREEVRNGRSPLNAIETGFSRALGTILDANITTFIAAVVLFGLGSGPISGFAITLGIGILTTIFTAFTVTRLLIAVWVRQRRPKAVPL